MTLRDFADRYGVTAAIVAAVSLLLLLLPSNVEPTQTGLAAGRADGSGVVDQGSVSEGGDVVLDGDPNAGGDAGAHGLTSGTLAAGRTGSRSVTGARSIPGVPSVQFGVGPCRPDGRELGIAFYMPPCLAWTKGDNGGATGKGVTRDKVTVVLFASQTDPATQAFLEGYKLADDRETVIRAFQALFRYSNHHYETYGREVVFVVYEASGPDSSDEAMKADAVKIANDIKPLAVIGGPKVLGMELVQRGIICLCTVSLTSDFYMSQPPYIFSSLPTTTEYAIHMAEYIGKRLAGKTAKWAGDEFLPTQGYRSQTRKFGMILLEGSQGRVDPEGKRIRDTFVRGLAKYGVKLSAEATYLYDPGRNQQDVTNMIATMKSAGVTSVIGLWDPIYPILITQEATRQNYYPEWVMSGTGLSDTTTAGRLYATEQWRHAFGISPLWVTWNSVSLSDGYREFHHGMPGMQPGDEGVLINIYRAPVQLLFQGIHLAGPKLNADTFSSGLMRYPRTGKLAAAPLVYLTRQYPTQIKDFTEVWFKFDERGKDERDEDGLGMVMKVDRGKRYEAGEWSRTDPKVFVAEGALATGGSELPGAPPAHEQDGHKHTGKCLTC